MAAISITPANVELISNVKLQRVQYGEAVTAGQAVYLKTSDNKHWKADNSTATLANVSGIAMIGGAADSYGYIITPSANGSIVDIGGTVTVGLAYYLGSTAGAIEPKADMSSNDYVTALCIGYTSTNVMINIRATGIQVP